MGCGFVGKLRKLDSALSSGGFVSISVVKYAVPFNLPLPIRICTLG